MNIGVGLGGCWDRNDSSAAWLHHWFSLFLYGVHPFSAPFLPSALQCAFAKIDRYPLLSSCDAAEETQLFYSCRVHSWERPLRYNLATTTWRKPRRQVLQQNLSMATEAEKKIVIKKLKNRQAGHRALYVQFLRCRYLLSLWCSLALDARIVGIRGRGLSRQWLFFDRNLFRFCIFRQKTYFDFVLF